MLSKLQFTCSQEHIERVFFRIFQNCFRTLSDNRPNLWRKVSAELPKLHSTCPKNLSIFLQNFVMFNLTSCSSEKKSLFWKKKFRQFCQNCILNVRELFDELFLQKAFFSIWLGIWAKIFQLCRKVSTNLSKMKFTCPEKHFDKNNMLTLWNNFRLWARKCLICGGKFAALLSNLLFCLQIGNWKSSFERIFTFSDFFRTSKEQFLVFSLYHSRHGGPN